MPLPWRGARIARTVVAVPVAVALYYQDTWWPPFERLLAQPGVLDFSASYWLELLGRFINWQMVALLALLVCGYLLLKPWLRVTTLSVLGMLGMAAMALPLPAALAGQVRADRAFRGDAGMRMNGLQFRSGLGVGADSRIDLALTGHWQLLRADLGIDDACRAAGGLQFQVWGDGRLLYDSGLVKAPGVVKPELDIRGLSALSLRTLGAQGSQPTQVCGNWANAVLIGEEGDSAELVAP